MTNGVDRAHPLLIFDLDGTLYDTRSSFLPAVRAVYQEQGMPYPTDREILAFVGEPLSVFLDWLLRGGFFGPREALEARIAELEFATIRDHGTSYPGVRPTLDRLKGAGYTIGLCTHGDRRYARAVLDACELLPLVDALETNEGVGRSKVGLLGNLLSRIPHDRAIVIGDRYHDVEAGRAHGCVVIAADYGYGTARELATADWHIERFPELLTLLERRPDARSADSVNDDER